MFDSWQTFRRRRRAGGLETWSSGHSWIQNARPARGSVPLAEQQAAVPVAQPDSIPVAGGAPADPE